MDCTDVLSRRAKRKRPSHRQPNCRVPITPAKKNGCALIISNGFESGVMCSRPQASKNDLEKMRQLWQDEVGCTLFGSRVYSNLSAQDMRNVLIRFANMTKKYDYLVIYISTHGDKISSHGQRSECIGFYGEDGEAVTESELMSYFRNDNCSHRGVTKFFILDYCRGPDKDENKKNGEFGMAVLPYRPPVPFQSDAITVYATHRGHTARQCDSGSFLTQDLYQVFKNKWETQSLTNMLMMVNKKMKERIEHGIESRSMSIFESSLADDFTFY